MRPPALLIRLAIIIFWIFRSLAWVEASEDALITLHLFSSSEIEPSPPLLDENKFTGLLRPSEEGSQDTPITLDLFSSQTEPLPRLLDENKFASLLRPSALFNMAGNTITAGYPEGRAGAEQLKSFWSDEERRELLKTLLSSRLADGRSLDTGYSTFDISSNRFTEQPRLLPFGLKGAWGDFDYEAEYRSMGKDFGYPARPQFGSDQTKSELRAQQKFGVFSVKTSVSEFSNNIETSPTIPRISTRQGGMSMNVILPSWPLFSLFYYRGRWASSSEPGLLRPGEASWETVGTSLYYGTSLWEATVSSTYSLNMQTSRSFTTQTETPRVSLGLTYRPLAGRLALTTFGSQSITTSADGWTNTRALNTSVFLVYDLEQSVVGKKTLSIGTTFNRYVNAIGPRTSYEDFALWARLKIAIF